MFQVLGTGTKSFQNYTAEMLLLVSIANLSDGVLIISHWKKDQERGQQG